MAFLPLAAVTDGMANPTRLPSQAQTHTLQALIFETCRTRDECPDSHGARSFKIQKSKISGKGAGSKVGSLGSLPSGSAVVLWISVREPRPHSNLKRTPPVPADQRRCASQRLRQEALRGRLRVPGSALSTVPARFWCVRGPMGFRDSRDFRESKAFTENVVWSVENTECRNTEHFTRAQHSHGLPLWAITSAECDSGRRKETTRSCP